MKSRPTWLYLLLVTSSVISGSCQTSEPQANNQEFTDNAQEEYQKVAEDDASDTSLAPKNAMMTHPREPTAWFTKKLIMVTPQPSSQDIGECVDSLDGKARSATNLDAMRKASLGLRSFVEKNKATYHWCFYQLMVNLDDKMEEPLSLMDEKADIFLGQMTRLWILASALDETNQSKVYMKYLRARYTSISQQTFGRALEVMDSEAIGFSNNGRGKSAGYFFEQQ